VEEVGTYEGHNGYVSGAVEIDENTIVTGADDCTLKVWDKHTYYCFRTIVLSGQVTSLHKSRDDSTLVWVREWLI